MKIWFGLAEPFKSYGVHKHFSGGGGQKPLIGGGLHLTFDAHFRTRMSYSSQKSCVKIWSGLVEIGGMLPPPLPLGEVTGDLRCPYSNLAEVF